MQLAVTILSNHSFDTIYELILSTLSCGCRIVDIKSSRFGDLHCAYFLVEGNWNQLSKYESTLHAIEKKMQIKIHSCRIEKKRVLEENMPYIIEVVGLESSDILNKVVTFLNERSIDVEEVSARRYPAPYLEAQLCAARFVISIPQNLSLFLFRDELMYVCDQINADVIFEPFRN